MGLDKVRITAESGDTVAEFVPDAAMLCSSLRVGGQELLDQGHGIDAYASLGKTMAIPLLYPWANRLATFKYSAAGRDVSLPEDAARIPTDPNGLPIHGVVPGLMRFAPEAASPDSTLSATLHWDTDELLELFPFRHEVTVDAAVDDARLTIATTVRATGDDPVPVSFGFHPYVLLPGSSRKKWRLELPPADHLLLDAKMIPTGDTEAAPSGDVELAKSSWDDAYRPHAEPARYAVSDGKGTISLEFASGYPYSQIYAPPGKDFICFEPMTAPTNALRSLDRLPIVEPGGAYRAVFSVSHRNDG